MNVETPWRISLIDRSEIPVVDEQHDRHRIGRRRDARTAREPSRAL
jgi:hypothetical protein